MCCTIRELEPDKVFGTKIIKNTMTPIRRSVAQSPPSTPVPATRQRRAKAQSAATNKSNAKSFICTECGKYYKTERTLGIHHKKLHDQCINKIFRLGNILNFSRSLFSCVAILFVAS